MSSFSTSDDPDFNINNGTYKFVEHMGDIAFHVVGNTLPQVYEQTLRAMFSYMCPTAKADILSDLSSSTAETQTQWKGQEGATEQQQQKPSSSGNEDNENHQNAMGAAEESAGDNDEGVAPSLKASAFDTSAGLEGYASNGINDNNNGSEDTTIIRPDADGKIRRTLDVKGNSLETLLFSLMNETLYLFHTTHFVPCFSVKVPVIEMSDFKSHTAAIGYVEKRSGVQNFKLRCVMEGGLWYPPQTNERGVRGTEIKAITKEGLLIDVQEEDGMWHGHSIVDI